MHSINRFITYTNVSECMNLCFNRVLVWVCVTTSENHNCKNKENGKGNTFEILFSGKRKYCRELHRTIPATGGKERIATVNMLATIDRAYLF